MTRSEADPSSNAPSGGDKRSLRSWAMAQPRCSADEGAEVADRLFHWLKRLDPGRVLAYMAMPGEIPVSEVVERLADRHRFYITRTPSSGPLTVHGFDAELERHRFGYLQPIAGSSVVDPSDLDVVLVPGLCFDRYGGRIGWGKGYYDELLGRAGNAQKVVGVTLTRFMVERVPVEEHDRMMTHLATEVGVSSVGG